MSLHIETVRTEGLGDSTYVLIHDGLALVVDPQRDIDRFENILERAQAELRMVVETHVHNDYVSGGRDLARSTGADLVMPAGAAPVFRHRPAFHHEEIDFGGGAVIRPLHTPGHTPEHTSYLFVLESVERAVFSAGACSSALPAGPTCSERNAPRAWRDCSTGRCSGWHDCPIRSGSIRLTEPGASAPLPTQGATPRPSARRRSAIRCWLTTPRTAS